MELSNIIKSLEDIKEQIYKRVPFNKYANTISKLNDVIAELKEFCEEENERRIKDLKKENERLREEIRKTNENKRRIKDLEKETKRLREEIRKTNNN